MSNNITTIRKQHFSNNWLTWAALHHFLSAHMLRELSYVIVDQMSSSSLSLDQLFDEAITDGPECLDSWVLQPLEVSTSLSGYLQYRIRAFAWQSDSGGFSCSEIETPSDLISPTMLDKAIELGAVDLACAEYILNGLEAANQSSFANFVKAFKISRASVTTTGDRALRAELESCISLIEMPLKCVVVKHIGDLFADSDKWETAQALYDQAYSMLEINADPVWEKLNFLLLSIIKQSQAAAARILTGAGQAADLLYGDLDKLTLKDNLLLHGNAFFDAFVSASYASSDLNQKPDRRSAILSSPLLLKSHHSSSALNHWLSGKFDDASRSFWSVLRRQIALGSATESRTTKAQYARCIFDELNQMIDRHYQPNLFRLALRLLLESGNYKSVSKIPWSDTLIEAYVDQQIVDFVINHTHLHEGSKLERQLVAIEIFKVWAQHIAADHIKLAATMLNYVVKLALEQSSFSESTSLGLGRAGLEALQTVARARPELRQFTESNVASAVSQKLHNPGYWTGRLAAFDTALAYIDAFSDESLGLVINTTLAVLDETAPEAGIWPIVRPALNLLVSEPVKCFSGQDPELGKRIVSTILHFGLKQESEHANVLIYLHNFDSSLLLEKFVQETLSDAVSHVRRKAKAINSSDTVANIQALLLAPAVSGVGGVKDALEGLSSILKSIKGARHSISLPLAYKVLLLLADRQHQIAKDISIDYDTFHSWLHPLVSLITDIWVVAKERPLIFTSFSIPPATQPDPVIIHNWAYASISIIESFNQVENLQSAFAIAAEQPVLANGIALARATRSAFGEINIDVEAIRAENREAFYTCLGRRLVVLQRLDEEKGRELCKGLLEQCFRVGPRELDAAVFLSAIRFDLQEYISHSSRSDYEKRLEHSRDLQLALSPILSILGETDKKTKAGT